MTAGAPAIRLDHLVKRYGRIGAVDDVSLEVEAGEIFGFLGLNGAGKTTTIRMLLDLVRPTAGRAEVFGHDCRESGRAVRADVGYLPSELGFYGDMTGEATLDLLGRLARRPVDPDRRRALLDRLQLSTRDLGRRVREYSTGMRRKLGLVQAFQADPPLLILDEPTDGLDPLMQDAVYALLADVRQRGRTVFMSSHVLPEVERVCDRIGLLRRGRLVLVSPVADVRRMSARRVTIAFAEPVPAPSGAWPDGCEAIAIAPRAWTLQVSGPLGSVMARIAGLPIADVDVHEPRLEDVLRRYYRDEDES
ncbi:MAG TPA: ABC transporter ATP-binding protein [Vicinamibacterales bacterium]|nr:ABC transporter ATP-binding protein [Vicinamibacterales bacterium]